MWTLGTTTVTDPKLAKRVQTHILPGSSPMAASRSHPSRDGGDGGGGGGREVKCGGRTADCQ